MTTSIKMYRTNCDNDRHVPGNGIAKLQLLWRSRSILRNFPLFVAVAIMHLLTFLPSLPRSKMRKICRGNFNAICCSSRDINIVELGDHVAISGGCPSLSPAVSIPIKPMTHTHPKFHPILVKAKHSGHKLARNRPIMFIQIHRWRVWGAWSARPPKFLAQCQPPWRCGKRVCNALSKFFLHALLPSLQAQSFCRLPH